MSRNFFIKFFLTAILFFALNFSFAQKFVFNPNHKPPGTTLTTTITANSDVFIGSTIQSTSYYYLIANINSSKINPVTGSLKVINSRTITLKWSIPVNAATGFYSFFVDNPPKIRDGGGSSYFPLTQANAFQVYAPYKIKGRAFNDVNGDGIMNANEKGLAKILIQVLPNDYKLYTDSLGNYSFAASAGEIKTMRYLYTKGWILTDKSPKSYTVTVLGNISNLNFGFQPTTQSFAYSGSFATSKITLPNCNKRVTYVATVTNNGTLPIAAGMFRFIKSSQCDLYSYNKGCIVSGDTISFSFTNLLTGTKTFRVVLTLPNFKDTIYNYSYRNIENPSAGVYDISQGPLQVEVSCNTLMGSKNSFIKLEDLVKDGEEKTEFNFSPNPANNFVTVKKLSTIVNAKVVAYDLSGKEMGEYNLDEDNTSISLENFIYGIYVFAVYSDKQLISTAKVAVVK